MCGSTPVDIKKGQTVYIISSTIGETDRGYSFDMDSFQSKIGCFE